MLIIWGLFFGLAVNVVMIFVLVVAVRRMKQMEKLIYLHLETQRNFEGLLLKLLHREGTGEPNESKE